MTDMVDRAKKTKERLDLISPSMCLAKWLQTTMILQTGQTHSCHHTPTHRVDPESLKSDPSGLHNTPQKYHDRALMLEGKRPSGCDYCWRVEDLEGDHLSDRFYKSATNWGWPNLPDVLLSGANKPINPSYLEVSFSNACNFKCAYCFPDISSKWMEEVKQHGGYPVSRGTRSLSSMNEQERNLISNRDNNPYVEAFWEWWPELCDSLHTFRITGGEPLMTKDTWKVFDYLLENPKSNLTLGVNSNMCVTEQLQKRLLEYAVKLEKSVKHFMLYTSAEATGSACNYIRFGMDYPQYVRNVDEYLRTTERSSVTVMVAFNIMSVTTFADFLEDFLILRRKYGSRVVLSVNFVRFPNYLDARILSPELKRIFADRIYNEFTANRGLSNHERDTGIRLIEDMMNEPKQRVVDMIDFGKFIQEYDRRKGTDFRTTFPELVEFYEECLEMGNAKMV